jgi:hypothetical protein
MATKIITSKFYACGIPAIALSPTIDIWQLNPTNPLLATHVVTAGLMVATPVNGWYRYDFTSYDPSATYVMTADGGTTLSIADRYKDAANESYEEDIAFEVWEEATAAHLIPATTGFILTFIRKMLTNRNRIDDTSNTLTIYDDDKITPLIVFNLKDFGGLPSITPIAERTPS